MSKKKNKKINWFWAHRRNASLHHMSILMQGLSGRGWFPAVNFWFDNQIVVGVPGKGCYFFYDKEQLSSKGKYRDIQKSIDSNPNFVRDFRRRTDEIFGAIFFKCMNINEDNLSFLSYKELGRLYNEFIDAMIVGPIITVQLWGIEACFDENYKIIKFLRKRLNELGKIREFQNYKEILSTNIGETVAFTEQKNFYQVASVIYENNKLMAIFKTGNAKKIIKKLKEKFEYENNLIEQHIKKYEWVNTEYVGGEWTREKWIALFKDAIIADNPPNKKLEEILRNFNELNQKRKKILKELDPPKAVMHAMNSLAELIAQRDWAKGYFSRALLIYNKLLNEIATRIKIEQKDILNYSYIEIINYFKDREIVQKTEIEKRENNGFAIVIKKGKFSLVTGKKNIKILIKNEDISKPFEKIIKVSKFKGLPVSRGIIKGIARVIEDASLISQLRDGEILITYMTTIEFIPAFRKASAVVTDEGGMSCHAAIISREFKLPCIVGTKVATRVIQTGDEIEVDAIKGLVRVLSFKRADL